MKYIVLGLLIIVIIYSIFSCKCGENFSSFKRKPASKKKIKLGFVKNTPGPLKNIIMSLQKTGGQMEQDRKYDKVAKEYLDPKNIN